jgi:hypothetical protein
MLWSMGRRCFAAALVSGLAGCGLYTPEKDPFVANGTNPDDTTVQGNYESGIAFHVQCEVTQGLAAAWDAFHLPWLKTWGTTVTQTITVEDQSGLSPGITSVTPLRNVVFPFATGGNFVAAQSFSASIGATASANALRTETIQYTFRNSDLFKYIDPKTCNTYAGKVLIDGDLKIKEFIMDKATIAALGNDTLFGNGPSAIKRPVFNTLTEEITFVAAYGGSATPTWHLARFTANTASNLLIGERTNTNDLIITLGPLESREPKKDSPVTLVTAAMNQHNARVSASAIAVAVQGQSH